MGLSISKQLVELMNGQIGVTSEFNHGSNFWFTLTFEKPVYAEPLPAAMKEAHKAMHILAIEDNASYRNVLSKRLTEFGCSFSITDNAVNSLAEFRDKLHNSTPFDLVLIDDTLPGVHGFELAQTIFAEKTPKMPRLILLESEGKSIRSTYDKETYQNAGISGVLTKPIQTRQLTHFLENEKVSDYAGENLHPARVRKSINTALSTSSLGHLNILLAEDNLINQELAMIILQKCGIKVQAVTNGQEAVNELSRNRFDLVLMDMQMPEMDGIQASLLIRDHSSAVLDHEIPIIAMTANAMRKDQEACLQAGMNDYISKPFETSQLIEKIIFWTKSAPVVLDQDLQTNIDPETAVNHPNQSISNNTETVPDGQVIEFELLYRRLLDDKELAISLLRKMDSRLDKELAEINQALEAGDLDQVRLLSHKLKGSAGNLSAEPLRHSLEELESAAKNSDRTDCDKKIKTVFDQAVEFHKAAAVL